MTISPSAHQPIDLFVTCNYKSLTYKIPSATAPPKNTIEI